MTSEAPKEVWISPSDDDGWLAPYAGCVKEPYTHSYTLTTHALAMVAAEREACADLCDCRDREKPDSLYILGAIDANQAAARRIRARTPADAQAALDALLRAERVRLLREIEVHHALALTGDADGRDCHAFVTDMIEKETGQ